MVPAAALVFLILVFSGAALWIIHTRIHRLKSQVVLTEKQYARLLELAERSLESSDVPVGALLLYKGIIIGEGYTTVLRNAKAGEHAEVNAISSAIAVMGMEKFSSLDRGSLILVSTFEPCLMCAGAFINYNIHNVYFMKEKELSYTGKEEAHFFRYLLQRKKIRNNDEQTSLFEKHPDYPARKKHIHQ
jgi:tRNA(Arg) A34 adenosine deaminase TadA